jgi:hypothetical protein
MADEIEEQQPVAVQEGEDIAVKVDEDKKRPALTDEDLSKSTEIPDDEIGRYANEAQRRIKGLRTAYQEQRRRAEQWSRDASTASNLAEQLYRENQDLRRNVLRSETALIDQGEHRAQAELEQAKFKLKQAYASQDTDLIVAANEEVSRAVAEVDRLRLLKPAAQAAERREAEAPPSQPAPVSERTRDWVSRNSWFGKDAEMTQFAMRQHQHLALDGITEDANPDLYWRTIEDKLKQQYPDKFSARQTDRARPVAVTGGTRFNGSPSLSAGGKQVIHLTESQVRLAKKLGVTLEDYAKQLVLEERESKEGRVQ